MATPVLYTIGPSHYCDKARWALQRAGITYRERASAPGTHLATMLPRGQRATPMLVTDDVVLRDSASIVEFADAALPPLAKLWPDHATHQNDARAFAARCDRELGPASRRVAYFFLFDDPELLTRIVCGPAISRMEAATFRTLRTPIISAMRRAMSINAEASARSLERIERIAEDVDELLSHGGRYLFGPRFSAADLTFASLFAPLVVPPGYGWPLCTPEEGPPGLRELGERFVARPCGAFVRRMYAEERTPAAPTPTPRASTPSVASA